MTPKMFNKQKHSMFMLLLAGSQFTSVSVVNATNAASFEYIGRISGQPKFNDTDYYASAISAVWTVAKTECADLFSRGTLLALESAEEHQFLSGFLEGRAGKYWTSGLYDIVSQRWRWDGSPTADFDSYTAWAPNEPSSETSVKRVSLQHNNQFSSYWISDDDSALLRFICEAQAEPTSPTTTPTTTPTPGGGPFTFDYSIAEDTYYEMEVDYVFLDTDAPQEMFDTYKAEGKTIMCYISVGVWEEWRQDADSFPLSVVGNFYDDWEGERWLDVRRYDILLPIMMARYQAAKEKGCDGIDQNNADGYKFNTGFPITLQDSLVYHQALNAAARGQLLLAGLKNAEELIPHLMDEVDFAVVDNCTLQETCVEFSQFPPKGKPVFAIEYTEDWSESAFRRDVCSQVEELRIPFILKRLNLYSSFYVSCL